MALLIFYAMFSILQVILTATCNFHCQETLTVTTDTKI